MNLEGVVTPDATFLLASGVSDILDSSETSPGMPEPDAGQPRRGFNGTRGEIPSMRAKRLRIERGEQQASVHIIADIEFGRDRFVLCACGFGCGGSSDRAMSDEFARHSGVRRERPHRVGSTDVETA